MFRLVPARVMPWKSSIPKHFAVWNAPKRRKIVENCLRDRGQLLLRAKRHERSKWNSSEQNLFFEKVVRGLYFFLFGKPAPAEVTTVSPNFVTAGLDYIGSGRSCCRIYFTRTLWSPLWLSQTYSDFGTIDISIKAGRPSSFGASSMGLLRCWECARDTNAVARMIAERQRMSDVALGCRYAKTFARLRTMA